MNHSCARTQRRWLRAQDGTLGWWGHIWLNRHLAGCPACRAFAQDAAAVATQWAALPLAEPGNHLRRALHHRAAEELNAVRRRTRHAEARRWSYALLGGTAAAVTTGLLVAFLNPSLFQGHRDQWREIDDGLERLRQQLVQEEQHPTTNFTWISLEEHLDTVEKRLDCLKLQTEQLTWNSLEGGDPCADS